MTRRGGAPEKMRFSSIESLSSGASFPGAGCVSLKHVMRPRCSDGGLLKGRCGFGQAGFGIARGRCVLRLGCAAGAAARSRNHGQAQAGWMRAPVRALEQYVMKKLDPAGCVFIGIGPASDSNVMAVDATGPVRLDTLEQNVRAHAGSLRARTSDAPSAQSFDALSYSQDSLASRHQMHAHAIARLRASGALDGAPSMAELGGANAHMQGGSGARGLPLSKSLPEGAMRPARH